MQDYKNLLVEFDQGILWVTINRPKDRNALHSETIEDLGAVFNWAEGNEQIRVIVLEGAGDQSFAAGADIKQLYERNWLESLEPGMQGLYKKIEHCSKDPKMREVEKMRFLNNVGVMIGSTAFRS